MEIKLNLATVTAREISGVLALFACVAPEALNAAIDGADLSDAAKAFGNATTAPDAADAFASAPMPEIPGHEPEAAPAPAAAAPPPPAPAAAPAAPAAPATVPAGAVLDKEGLPWDARIHATIEGGGGKITKDGLWRAKRGVSADAKAAVAAELKAALAAGGAPAVPPVPAAPAAPAPAPAAAAPPPPSAPATPAPSAEPAPSAPPPPAAPAAPAAPPAPAPAADQGGTPPAAQQFAALMGKVTQAQTAGKITQETVTSTLQGLGLAQLRDLLTRPDLLPVFDATIDALIGG